VSRTSTAPFDRLRVFLMTRAPDLGGTSLHPESTVRGAKAIMSAIARIYAEGGIAAFWVGNGLSVIKIFPESAIKFLTYEASVCPTLIPVMTRERALKGILVRRNASSLVILTMWKISAKSAERAASCREASVVSRANLASIPLLR
jgi:hypothetical protein